MSPAYRARPRFVEQALGLVTLLVLTVGLPNEWFVVIVGDASDDVNVGGLLVIAVFSALIGSLLFFSMKRPKAMFYLLVCELMLVSFSLLILFSPLWSVDFSTSFRRSVALLLTTLLGIYFVARYSLEQLLNRLSIVFFVAMIINLVWVFALPQYGVASGGAWTGITTNRNYPRSAGRARLLDHGVRPPVPQPPDHRRAGICRLALPRRGNPLQDVARVPDPARPAALGLLHVPGQETAVRCGRGERGDRLVLRSAHRHRQSRRHHRSARPRHHPHRPHDPVGEPSGADRRQADSGTRLGGVLGRVGFAGPRDLAPEQLVPPHRPQCHRWSTCSRSASSG